MKELSKSVEEATEALEDTFNDFQKRDPDNVGFTNPDPIKEVEYITREAPKAKTPTEEIKKYFSKEKQEFEERWEGIDKEKEIQVNFDNSPMFMKEGGLEPGNYVVRDGELIKGKKAKKREEAIYSNWYCSNADPEDIMKHRQMMDRMSYKGPVWDGLGVPMTGMEEKNPKYRPCLLYTSPSPRDKRQSRMPSSA